MKLNLSQIQSIATGVSRVTEEEDGFHFYRFTKEQETLYKERDPAFYQKTFCTSGVTLHFTTDSRTLTLRAKIQPGSSRIYFSFDVAINGHFADGMEDKLEKTFDLGEGEKTVQVYLPWSVQGILQEVILEDDSSLTPVKAPRKLLCFGDSITHGYDARHPYNKYATALARFLQAEEHNKGIGGEIFFPDLATTQEDFVPDYITVAYGTNDWNNCSREEFDRNCMAFFARLSENYPKSRIYAITPIWRADFRVVRKFGFFDQVEASIRQAVAGLENVTVISGFDLVPHEESLYADLYLHPNDEGFLHYGKNLCSRMRTYLFDFDGTLVDSMQVYVGTMLKILDDFGIPYPDDVVKIITPLGTQGAADYYVELGVPLSRDEIITRMGAGMIEAYHYHIPAKKNVIETIRALKARGASLNVLTASPHITLDACLKRLGIYDLFDHVWSCDDFGTTKADPEIYKMAAKEMGVPTRAVLFLDDNLNSDKTAKLAGMQVCGVYDESSADYVDAIKEVADYYIYDFEELQKIPFCGTL